MHVVDEPRGKEVANKVEVTSSPSGVTHVTFTRADV